MNCARWDLCGGRSVMGVPTAISPDQDQALPSISINTRPGSSGGPLRLMPQEKSNQRSDSCCITLYPSAVAFGVPPTSKTDAAAVAFAPSAHCFDRADDTDRDVELSGQTRKTAAQRNRTGFHPSRRNILPTLEQQGAMAKVPSAEPKMWDRSPRATCRVLTPVAPAIVDFDAEKNLN